MKIRISTIAISILALAVAAVGWIFFAPTQLGGSTSYMIIRGVSMHPTIHAGDLVIVRKQSSYPVGAVVAYRDTLSKQTILHRIVARSGDKYVFQGDNRKTNPHPDAFRPTKAQLMGTKWILIPYAGRALAWIQVPTNAALFAIGAVILAAGGGASTKRKRRPKGGPAAGAPPRQRRINPLYAIPLGLLVISLALAAVAFSRGKNEQVSVANGYQQTGDFSYSGRAHRGIVYPSGVVSTGQTVFSNLVDRVTFSFRYQLRTDESAALSGTATLNARFNDPTSQFSRVFTLARSSFHGSGITIAGVFPLRSYINRMFSGLQAETKYAASGYSVTIAPTIQVRGLVGSQPVNETFAPSLDFLLDTNKMVLDTSGGSTAMHVSKTSSGTTTRERSVNLRIAKPSVSTARSLSLAGIVLALLGTGLLVGVGVKRRLGDEPEQIERLYGHLLLPVTQLPDFERIVECDSIDALATLADRYDRAILYHRESGIHTYVLQDEGLAYRYSAFDDALLRPEAYLAAPPSQPAAPAYHSEPPQRGD
ncbi:MAG: S24 family peptidase [Gaiellaceae bacterium]|jgi:signal peptidase I